MAWFLYSDKQTKLVEKSFKSYAHKVISLRVIISKQFEEISNCFFYFYAIMKHVLATRLNQLLQRRAQQGALRQPLQLGENASQYIDFASNDYLGLARDKKHIKTIAQHYEKLAQIGATGSRLLTGNHWLCEDLERQIAQFHKSENALLFNSGYDANIGWLPALSRKTDVILYDAAIHASLHDAMQMIHNTKLPFQHNNAQHLEVLLADLRLAQPEQIIFVLVESVYSMDGDIAPLKTISEICEKYNAILFVDEAHCHGIFGEKGEGLVQHLGLEKKVDLRLHTFGKAFGTHGAALLCSTLIKNYCLNYARSLIYTTALDIHTLVSIQQGYFFLEKGSFALVKNKLFSNVNYFKMQAQTLPYSLQINDSPIQFITIGNNQKAKALSAYLLQNNIDVRPILAPTVNAGKEGLRICLHAYNSYVEIDLLITLIRNFI